MVQHFNVGLLEDVSVRVVLVGRCYEKGVYAEEISKLLIEVSLFNVRARCRRNPQFLRVALQKHNNRIREPQVDGFELTVTR